MGILDQLDIFYESGNMERFFAVIAWPIIWIVALFCLLVELGRYIAKKL